MEETLIIITMAAIAITLQIVYRKKLYHTWRERITAAGIIFIVLIPWEFYAQKSGMWVFPGPGMIGVRLFGSPIEVIIFYIIAPYSIFVLFETLHIWMDKK